MMLSIVIVSWNTAALLAQSLESIRRQMVPFEYEVIVVDNASTDGTAQAVQTRFPWVRLVRNHENSGFARANNRGIRLARGAYVLLLNPDTELRPGALATLVDFMNRQPAAGAAGSRLVNPDGSLQLSCFPAPSLSRECWRLFHLDCLWPYSRYATAGWHPTDPREVDTVQGAALVVRRAVLEEVGLLDEAYFMYSEEIDWCTRIRQAGWPIYWVPQSVVVHYGGQSTRQVAEEMFLHLYRGKSRYMRKHYGHGAARLYKLILLGASLARLLLTPLVLLAPRADRRDFLILATYYRRLLLALPGL